MCRCVAALCLAAAPVTSRTTLSSMHPLGNNLQAVVDQVAATHNVYRVDCRNCTETRYRHDAAETICPSGGSTLGPRGHRPLQIVASPQNLAGPQIVPRAQNLAVLLAHSGQLILRKISKFDATRCQILRLDCTKFDFRWGSATDPAGEACSSPQTHSCI